MAVRDHAAPWRLFDVTGETTTTIETFFADEERDAQAVAERESDPVQ
jgi:hypothetical protein